MRRALAIGVALAAVGCSVRVKDDRAAFCIDPAQAFRLEFGRGSGMHGLYTIRVNQDGSVFLHRPKAERWETATLRLQPDALAEVLNAVTGNDLMVLHRAYHDPNIDDGAQWVLWIKQGEQEKSVYFNNIFPSQIKRFAEQLDGILRAAGLGAVVWQPVPASESRRHELELWDSIKR